MTLDTLKGELIKAGWTILPPNRLEPSGADWTACKATKGLPVCECNDRSPQLILTPWPHEKAATTVTVKIQAETKDGIWLCLEAYGLIPEMGIINAACPRLVAAWIGGAEATTGE